MIELIRDILTDQRFLVVWLVLAGLSSIIHVVYLVRKNTFLMKPDEARLVPEGDLLP